MVLICGTCSTYMWHMWYICLVHVALTCVTFSTYQTVFTHVVWHLLLTAGINEGIVFHSIRFGCVAFNAIDWFSTYHRHKGIKRHWGQLLLHQVYLRFQSNLLNIHQTNWIKLLTDYCLKWPCRLSSNYIPTCADLSWVYEFFIIFMSKGCQIPHRIWSTAEHLCL